VLVLPESSYPISDCLGSWQSRNLAKATALFPSPFNLGTSVIFKSAPARRHGGGCLKTNCLPTLSWSRIRRRPALSRRSALETPLAGGWRTPRSRYSAHCITCSNSVAAQSMAAMRPTTAPLFDQSRGMEQQARQCSTRLISLSISPSSRRFSVSTIANYSELWRSSPCHQPRCISATHRHEFEQLCAQEDQAPVPVLAEGGRGAFIQPSTAQMDSLRSRFGVFMSGDVTRRASCWPINRAVSTPARRQPNGKLDRLRREGRPETIENHGVPSASTRLALLRDSSSTIVCQLSHLL